METFQGTLCSKALRQTTSYRTGWEEVLGIWFVWNLG